MFWMARRQMFGVVRVLLGISCVVDLLARSKLTFSWLAALFVAYSIYALAELLGKGFEESAYPLLALGIDSGLLLAALASSPPLPYWIALIFFVFALCTAILRQYWWGPEIITILSVAVLETLRSPYERILLPGVIGAGFLGSVAVLDLRLLRRRLDKAVHQITLHRFDAEKARESERQRIAADFHDGPLQLFISFQMRLEIIRKLLSRDRDAAEEDLIQLQHLCKTQVQELRTFVRGMRPLELDGSLNASLRRVVDQFQKDSGIPVTFISAEFIDAAEPDIALELLQIVREALYNIQKHSAATRVAVTIQKVERAIEITVEDNGNGFPFSGRYTLEELELLRLGPGSIKRRVRSLGGELLVNSRPGYGAGLTVRLGT